VGQKLRRFDPANRIVHYVTEFLALFIGNCGLEVLNFDQALVHEHHLRHIVDSRNPGIAN